MTATTARSTDAVVVEFAASLRRHVDCAPQTVAPGSLRSVLEAALAAAPPLAHYVFDDQRAVRRHVAVFVNQQMQHERARLDQPVRPGDRVLVIQALTGG
ncbi:MAG: MoaD/ThiS family protein [Proteobacteria bacterium]|nr:MoaD/ThiS family protein [Pseudomonadota bacterium]